MCVQFFKKSSLGLPAAFRLRRVMLGACLLIPTGACKRSPPHASQAPAPPQSVASSRPLRVAAASDLEPAFSAVGTLFQTQHHRPVVFSFAGSMALSQQIEHGAPFDLYAAASQHHVDTLVKKGRIDPASVVPYARGALVLWTRPVPPGSPHDALSVPLPARIDDLTQPQYRRIALANPDHAPYGVAAMQTLHSAGVYDALQARLVFGENIRQAHQFVATGNADVVLDALSLAVAAGSAYTRVPQALYAPLVQALGYVRGGDAEGAAAFAALLRSDEGQRVLGRFGFAAP